MKHLYLILLTFLLIEAANAESIYPDITNEFCPNTEYTFTVTIPKTYSSMPTVWSNIQNEATRFHYL